MRISLRFRTIVTAAAVICSCATPLGAQESSSVPVKVRKYRLAHENEIVGEFTTLLSIPNLASDIPNIERNAQAITKALESRGVSVQLLRAPGSPPIIYGRLSAPGVRPTIGIYAHYDGQPVDSPQWQSPPFSPVLRDTAGQTVDWKTQNHYDSESRIYARSAGDDKAAIAATISALDALSSVDEHLSVNVKFLFDGEEESGSPHLAEILSKNPGALEADIWLLCDGPLPPSRRMQVFFGNRGETDLEMTVYGPARPMHTGNYGNWAPNPIVLVTHLLDSMRDTDAKILIPGFYDDVRALAASERQVLASSATSDEPLKQEFAIAAPEGNGASLAEQLLKPALNVRGIRAGYVGERVNNTISSEAIAMIDFRLVPNQTEERVRQQVEEHIAKQGFFIVHQTPDKAIRMAHARVVRLEWKSDFPVFRTAMDDPTAQAVVKAIERAKGASIVQAVSMGGTVPMYLLAGSRHTPVLGVPIANHDDNQHAADENLRLQNLWDAIEVYATIFATVGNDKSAWPLGDH
jgi:acetylornithine deacetylase/succinyl-diaminopimelate desuccinylase-like protein